MQKTLLAIVFTSCIAGAALAAPVPTATQAAGVAAGPTEILQVRMHRRGMRHRMVRHRMVRHRMMRHRAMNRRARMRDADNAMMPSRPLGQKRQGMTSGGPAR